MKLYKSFSVLAVTMIFMCSGSVSNAGGNDYSSSGQEDPNKKILKQGLLGAGVGAISAEASGGKAGTGALVGAGTNVIGGALLDSLTTSPQPQRQPVYQQQPVYVDQGQYPQQYPVQVQGQQYQQQQPVYVQQQPVYYQQAPPQENQSNKILKQGLLGAGVGAISASASGGKAGKGALIGAGTNVIGSALLDSLTSSPQPQQQPVYYQQAPQPYPNQGYTSSQTQPHKKIIRKYDKDGNVVSEEEIWE